MKTSCLIRNIILVGIGSLSLASCGGGGGGESSPSGNDTTTNTPSTQSGYAPYNLSGCKMTYTYNGKPYTFTFDDSGKVSGVLENGSFTTNYDGTYTYSRSADGRSASLMMKTTSGTSSQGISYTQTFDMKLAFSSATQATAQVSYTNNDSYNGNEFSEDNHDYSVTVTFSGAGVQDSDSSEGESNDDTTSDDSTQLAPESLSIGSVINLTSDSGAKKSYTLTSASDCISESGSKLTWEYSCTGETTADFIARNALNLPSTYKLVFTTADSGTYTYFNAGGQATLSGTFNLSDKADAPSQDDDNSDIGEDDRTDGDAADTPVVNEAPAFIKGMKWGSTTFYFNGDGTCLRVSSDGSSRKGVYTYKKSTTNPGEADLTMIWEAIRQTNSVGLLEDVFTTQYFQINLNGDTNFRNKQVNKAVYTDDESSFLSDWSKVTGEFLVY